jgi:ribosomal protein S18 acetylase RimI-like enzyme
MDQNSRITRRAASDADLDLLYRIVREALGPYVVQTWGKWDDAEQRRRFDEVTRAEDHAILEVDGGAVGCLCVRFTEDACHLNRLMILPECQNRGIGGRVLAEILQDAKQRGVAVKLRVLKVNPARLFYERYGFVVNGQTDWHYSMVCEPSK